jgi:hypothetical protein
LELEDGGSYDHMENHGHGNGNHGSGTTRGRGQRWRSQVCGCGSGAPKQHNGGRQQWPDVTSGSNDP